MLKDKELTQFRQTYYGLLVRIWLKEPVAEFIAALHEDITGRIDAARLVHPLMGEGWRVIQNAMARQTPEEIADEFTRLFLGPFAPKVNPYECYYLTGRFYTAPLVTLRSFLKRLGLEKQGDEFREPEDILAFELEVMRWLIGKQMTAGHPEEEERWLQLQTEFLKDHLLVWAPTCAQDIENAEGAEFYRGAAMILRGFLEIERTLFRDLGLDKVASLDEVRRRYGAITTWKGPTFDVSGDDPENPSPPREK